MADSDYMQLVGGVEETEDGKYNAVVVFGPHEDEDIAEQLAEVMVNMVKDCLSKIGCEPDMVKDKDVVEH